MATFQTDVFNNPSNYSSEEIVADISNDDLQRLEKELSKSKWQNTFESLILHHQNLDTYLTKDKSLHFPQAQVQQFKTTWLTHLCATAKEVVSAESVLRSTSPLQYVLQHLTCQFPEVITHAITASARPFLTEHHQELLDIFNQANILYQQLPPTLQPSLRSSINYYLFVLNIEQAAHSDTNLDKLTCYNKAIECSKSAIEMLPLNLLHRLRQSIALLELEGFDEDKQSLTQLESEFRKLEKAKPAPLKQEFYKCCCRYIVKSWQEVLKPGIRETPSRETDLHAIATSYMKKARRFAPNSTAPSLCFLIETDKSFKTYTSGRELLKTALQKCVKQTSKADGNKLEKAIDKFLMTIQTALSRHQFDGAQATSKLTFEQLIAMNGYVQETLGKTDEMTHLLITNSVFYIGVSFLSKSMKGFSEEKAAKQKSYINCLVNAKKALELAKQFGYLKTGSLQQNIADAIEGWGVSAPGIELPSYLAT